MIAVVHPKEKPPITVVGDVAEHIAIVVVCLFIYILCLFNLFRVNWLGLEIFNWH